MTCDVNAAARLIDLTAYAYVCTRPCWAVRATVAAVAGERGAAHAHVHVCCGFLPNSPESALLIISISVEKYGLWLYHCLPAFAGQNSYICSCFGNFNGGNISYESGSR